MLSLLLVLLPSLAQRAYQTPGFMDTFIPGPRILLLLPKPHNMIDIFTRNTPAILTPVKLAFRPRTSLLFGCGNDALGAALA